MEGICFRQIYSLRSPPRGGVGHPLALECPAEDVFLKIFEFLTPFFGPRPWESGWVNVATQGGEEVRFWGMGAK